MRLVYPQSTKSPQNESTQMSQTEHRKQCQRERAFKVKGRYCRLKVATLSYPDNVTPRSKRRVEGPANRELRQRHRNFVPNLTKTGRPDKTRPRHFVPRKVIAKAKKKYQHWKAKAQIPNNSLNEMVAMTNPDEVMAILDSESGFFALDDHITGLSEMSNTLQERKSKRANNADDREYLYGHGEQIPLQEEFKEGSQPTPEFFAPPPMRKPKTLEPIPGVVKGIFPRETIDEGSIKDAITTPMGVLAAAETPRVKKGKSKRVYATF